MPTFQGFINVLYNNDLDIFLVNKRACMRKVLPGLLPFCDVLVLLLCKMVTQSQIKPEEFGCFMVSSEAHGRALISVHP